MPCGMDSLDLKSARRCGQSMDVAGGTREEACPVCENVRVAVRDMKTSRSDLMWVRKSGFVC